MKLLVYCYTSSYISAIKKALYETEDEGALCGGGAGRYRDESGYTSSDLGGDQQASENLAFLSRTVVRQAAPPRTRRQRARPRRRLSPRSGHDPDIGRRHYSRGRRDAGLDAMRWNGKLSR